MCLAIPGLVEEIIDQGPIGKIGKVKFGAIIREINLDCVTQVKIGDYVIAHAGVALQILDQVEADATILLFKDLEKNI